RPPTVSENVRAEYQQLEFSLTGHPISHWRPRLQAAGILTVAELEGCGSNCRVRVAGLPVLRQRPATASGVVFVTLEDETGSANLVLWGVVAERDRSVLRASRLIAEGRVQREGPVLHVVVDRLLPWEVLRVSGPLEGVQTTARRARVRR
ncbi:MAG TPA: OB-fold nucleic acid binding domain-containing protein, partial [Acidiferrobacteraceae bacterium]|nr:OB-fold nucleic acid binding domain-containing protein [Acidiferrobacteraceae bacterium]